MLDQKEYGILLMIVKHCKRIGDKLDNVTQDYFNSDEDLKEVICFNLFQIGELAKKLSDKFINDYNLVPWKQIKGMRDKIVHGYDTINLGRIWYTSKEDVHELYLYCMNIIKKENAIG